MEISAFAAIVSAILGYVLGSIPFGLVLTRLAGMGDVRTIGSGNIGATNVLRTGNKALAAATLALDMLKGTAAVVAAGIYAGEAASLVAGFFAFLGHCFPVWLGFKGGKGVATFLGILIGVAWPAAIGFAAIWLTVAAITRYSSLAALVATLGIAIAMLLIQPLAAGLTVTALTAICWIKHHANIKRLVEGTESRIGAKG